MMDSFPQKLTIYIRGEDEDPVDAVDSANTSSVMKSEFMNDSTREVVGVVAEPNKTDFIKGREKVMKGLSRSWSRRKWAKKSRRVRKKY